MATNGRKLIFEVIMGPEGPCLAIGNDNPKDGAFRLAGPKPWGGGEIIHTFVCDPDEVRQKVEKYSPST